MSEPLQLEVRRADRETRMFSIPPGIYRIGSDDDCPIHLPHADIEGHHAVLTADKTSSAIEDLDTHGGTFLDGARIRGREPLNAGQAVAIGPYVLILHPSERAVPPEPSKGESATVPPPADSPGPPPETGPPVARQQEATPDEVEQRRAVKQQIHKELLDRLDLKRMAASRVNEEELRERAFATIRTIVRDVHERLPDRIDPEQLVHEVYNEAVGLGPLVDLLEDESITEIMVNGHSQVFVERQGRLERTELSFMDNASVLAIIERIVSPLGRRVDESQPYVDARLPDGSRVNAIIHPLSLIGPCLTIRKFSKVPFTDADLIRFGTITPAMVAFAQVCVRLRKNIVISGGTGSGKTTLLNVMSSFLPPTDRILTIEDAAELRLPQPHVVRLEARPPNIEGRGAITIRDLVRNALRMRPDRIVVGECRGGEALDMLQAMNTGHDGSLTTVHANSPRDVISRLETMVLMSGMDLPIRAIREQIAAAIHVIVHESRFSDGTRKVTQISEVVGLEGDQITMQELFEFQQTGVDQDGGVIGSFKPTGAVPTFVDEIESRGLTIDRAMFDPERAEG